MPAGALGRRVLGVTLRRRVLGVTLGRRVLGVTLRRRGARPCLVPRAAGGL